jgi:hypothetical protein
MPNKRANAPAFRAAAVEQPRRWTTSLPVIEQRHSTLSPDLPSSSGSLLKQWIQGWAARWRTRSWTPNWWE